MTPHIAPAASASGPWRGARRRGRPGRRPPRGRRPSPRRRPRRTPRCAGARTSAPTRGRAGVEHGPPLEPGDQLPRAPAPTIIGRASCSRARARGVAGVDARVAVGGREGGDHAGSPPRGRAPVDRVTSAPCSRRASAIRSRPAVAMRRLVTGMNLSALARACRRIPACGASGSWPRWPGPRRRRRRRGRGAPTATGTW